MKRFQWKLAGKVLLAFVALDASCFGLGQVFSQDFLPLLIVVWILNAPAALAVWGFATLTHLFIGPGGDDTPAFGFLIITLFGIFSAIVWATISGFVFCKKKVANQSPATPSPLP